MAATVQHGYTQDLTMAFATSASLARVGLDLRQLQHGMRPLVQWSDEDVPPSTYEPFFMHQDATRDPYLSQLPYATLSPMQSVGATHHPGSTMHQVGPVSPLAPAVHPMTPLMPPPTVPAPSLVPMPLMPQVQQTPMPQAQQQTQASMGSLPQEGLLETTVAPTSALPESQGEAASAKGKQGAKQKKSKDKRPPGGGPNPVNVDEWPDTDTTVMLRNISSRYTAEEIIVEMMDRNFADTFDMLYLPMDFKSHRNMGYCFVNFVKPENARRFAHTFNGIALPRYKSSKVLEVSRAFTQGLRANLDAYQKKDSQRVRNPWFRPMIFNVEGSNAQEVAGEFFDDIPAAADIMGV